MKVLRNYLIKMSNERYVYCQTILKLMKHGYNYKSAKSMFYESDILDKMYNDTNFFFQYQVNDWAEWIIKEYKHKYKKYTCFNILKHKLLKALK